MDRLVLVTGAGRGIGAAVALAAAARGYVVGVNYRRDRAAAEAVCAAIAAAGGHAVPCPGDVASEAGVAAVYAALDACGVPLRALVNNAGVTGRVMPFVEYTAERLRTTFDTNLLGAFLCAREAVKRMLANDAGGAIVNVSSAAARLGSPHEFIDYAASKGAIDTFTLGLAREYGERGIRVNAVRPGIIRTSIHASAGAVDRVERLGPQVPLGRAGEVDEVARTILWLLSDEASYVTGALVDVAGGR
ncbi:MAG: SDR family oxidoreductase [Gammaproteobacteria bacterium]|nr:SDR family oxidoreductase [Gammaproteobacteria bacterium]